MSKVEGYRALRIRIEGGTDARFASRRATAHVSLVELGHDQAAIRAERFGPTGA
jgi:hypothetical protein